MRFLLFLGLIILVFCCPTLAADDDATLGVKCYEKKDYKGALAHFQKRLRIDASDYNALYYSAVIYHRLGFLAQARQAYAKIMQTYPNSGAAKNAAAAMAYLDPAYLRQFRPANNAASAPVSGTGIAAYQQEGEQIARTSGSDILPDESQVYFEPIGNNLLIDAYVNNRPLKMIFDTGAETVVLGKNHLAELGIPAPQGKPTGLAVGIGAGGAQRTWHTYATIKVGQIERQNFPVTIQEDMPTQPLLGQTFFKDFYYSIQKGAGGTGTGSIRFRKRSSATAGPVHDSDAVPFTRQGNEVVVAVEINGRKLPMYFDTGAEHCVFSEGQLRQVGLSVPDDAQVGVSMGIAGQTRARSFTVNRIKLGPVEKTDVPVTVVDSYGMPYPLLGQTFFGDLRYEFDNQAHVLRIRR